MDIKFYNNKISNNPIIFLTNPQKAGILQTKKKIKRLRGRVERKFTKCMSLIRISSAILNGILQ